MKNQLLNSKSDKIQQSRTIVLDNDLKLSKIINDSNTTQMVLDNNMKLSRIINDSNITPIDNPISNGLLLLSCGVSGQAWLINTSTSPWTYSAAGGCLPGDPWVSVVDY
jgi:hypothetical protein